MNQVLQRCVYQLGTDEQANFIADISGMKGEVREMYLMFHDGKKEREICHALGIEHDAFQIIESTVRTKFLMGVFDCVLFRMNYGK